MYSRSVIVHTSLYFQRAAGGNITERGLLLFRRLESCLLVMQVMILCFFNIYSRSVIVNTSLHFQRAAGGNITGRGLLTS